MSKINGGGWIGGFCGVFTGGAAVAYYMGISAVTGGVGGVIVGIGLIGCAAYGIYTMNN